MNTSKNNQEDHGEGEFETSMAKFTLSKNKTSDNLKEIGSDGKFLRPNKTLTTEEKKERYEEIIYNQNSDDWDIGCLICLKGDSLEGNGIFLCDLCDSAFHQRCYGSELLNIAVDFPDLGDWFCHRCAYLLEHDLPFSEIRCEFCPEMKGAIKRIQQSNDKHWGHINCVNWIPEIYYENDAKKENAHVSEYWQNSSYGRKEMLCSFCGIQYGDCINCNSEIPCQTAFHVTCAQLHGLLTAGKEGEENMPIHCKSHLAEEFSEEQDLIEKKNLSQIEGISYLFHQPSDQENNKKPQDVRED